MAKFVLCFVIFAAFVGFSHVDALYSQRCKEAETSEHKLTRIIENANCTLQAKRQKIHEGLNHLHKTFQGGLDLFKNNFAKTTPSPSTSTTENDKLDFNIDVRMLTDDTERNMTKREAVDKVMSEASAEGN
jgi:hypothetical protein